MARHEQPRHQVIFVLYFPPKFASIIQNYQVSISSPPSTKDYSRKVVSNSTALFKKILVAFLAPTPRATLGSPAAPASEVITSSPEQTKLDHHQGHHSFRTRQYPASLRLQNLCLDVMAANAKYSAAPQRDSLDTAHYSQAPPSYADEPSSSTDQAALLGGPRSSEDNIPDDFKVGSFGLVLIREF